MNASNNTIKYACIYFYLLNVIDWFVTKKLLIKDFSGESNILYTFMVNFNLDIVVKFLLMGLISILLYKLSYREGYYTSVLYGSVCLCILYSFVLLNNIYVLLFWSF